MSIGSMTFDQLRQDLPITQKMAYFQSGGHGPTPESVIKVVYDNMIYLSHNGYPMPETRQVLKERENGVRQQLADFLNVKTEELAWTQNTSQAIQQILHGIRWQPGDEFVISSAEHITTKRAGHALEKYYGAVVKTIPADEGDETLLEALHLILTERTRLVCLSQVTTLDGRRLPISEAASIAHQRGVPVMVDGAQSLGQYLVDVAALGCDFFVGSSHKWLLGPRGLGFVWVASERIPDFRPGFIPDYDPWLEPGEPRSPITAATRVELGTCDLAKRIGMGRALEIMTSLGLDRIEAHAAQLADDLVHEVEQWPGAKIITPREPGSASGLLALTFDGYDEPRLCNLIANLMQERVVVKFQPELTAMRVSIASFNNADEVGRLLETLKHLIFS